MISPSVHDQEFSPSPGGSSSSSSAASALMKSRTSLAEDINAIKHALEGASVSAREKTLKILERLTARLALAETERDSAMSKLSWELPEDVKCTEMLPVQETKIQEFHTVI